MTKSHAKAISLSRITKARRRRSNRIAYNIGYRIMHDMCALIQAKSLGNAFDDLGDLSGDGWAAAYDIIHEQLTNDDLMADALNSITEESLQDFKELFPPRSS